MEALAIGATRVWTSTRRKQQFQYRVIKVSHHGSQRQRWRSFARHWWETQVSPIPDGYHVFHRDGNPLNDDPANLVLSRGEYWKLIYAAVPGSAEKRARRQAAGVAKSNRNRASIDLAMTRPRMWYVVLPASRAIVWLPCVTAREAVQALTPDELVSLCASNSVRIADHKCRPYQIGDRVTVARGRDITAGSELDGMYCGFIRLIPDTRRPPRKRTSKPVASDLESV